MMLSPPVISHGRARARPISAVGSTPDQTAPELVRPDAASHVRAGLMLPSPSLSPATPLVTRSSALVAGRKRSAEETAGGAGGDDMDADEASRPKRGGASFSLSPRQHTPGGFASPVPRTTPTGAVLWNVPSASEEVEAATVHARRTAIARAYAARARERAAESAARAAGALELSSSAVSPSEPSPFRVAVVSLSPGSLGQEVTSSPLLGVGNANVTSIKFSPTGSHLLIGLQPRPVPGLSERPHQSMPVAVVHRVSDMKLLSRVMSRVDEVNVALFSPVPGDGFVYGTRQGRVRATTPLLLDVAGEDD